MCTSILPQKMGEHYCRFQALLWSSFVWLHHWSQAPCCFVLSALQFILRVVLKSLINLAFSFFFFLLGKQYHSCDHIFVGCLSWCHPSFHYTSELELLIKNTSWVLEVEGNAQWPFLSPNIERVNDVVPEGFISPALLDDYRRLLVNPQFEYADWRLLLPSKYIQSCWILQ